MLPETVYCFCFHTAYKNKLFITDVEANAKSLFLLFYKFSL
ncbi:hypothetical protein B4144_3059 [Bacillus atrophaeus]|nr:hypothetical protein B4144_3059 [Bacillus atrophaeus]